MKKKVDDSAKTRRSLFKLGVAALAGGLLVKLVGQDEAVVRKVYAQLENLIGAVPNAPVLFAANTATTGDAQGIQGLTQSPSGRGLVGFHQPTSGVGIGLDGVSNSPAGKGLRGANTATTGDAIGVEASTASSAGAILVAKGAGGVERFRFREDGARLPKTGTTPLQFIGDSGTTTNNRMVIAHTPDFPDWGLYYNDPPDRFEFWSGGSPVAVIGLGDGRVGIGEAVPGTKLHVRDGSIYLAASALGSSGVLWFKTQHLGTLSNHHMYIEGDPDITRQESISIYHSNQIAVDNPVEPGTGAGGRIFRFQWDGNAYAVAAWNVGGVDVAEKFADYEPGLEAGDVVVLDPAVDMRLAASRGVSQPTLLGVVSESPGVVLGGNDRETNETAGLPVALVGRVPVKVTLENGPIKTGDPLTSSSKPGYAAKAVKTGRVIGIALESFGLGDTQSGQASKMQHTDEGKILIFVNPHAWINPKDYEELRNVQQVQSHQIAALSAQLGSVRKQLEQS